MKLIDENARSYIDDIKEVGLLRFMTWKGIDVAAAWKGGHMPATHSDDSELVSLAKFNRDHYLYYLALIEKYVDKIGNILDVGCGTGSRTALLGRYANRVVGVDSDLLKIHAASYMNGDGGNKLWWVGGDFMEWVTDEKFDYVFAVEVIEHIQIEKQERFIEKGLSLLNKGGSMLMTTPRDQNPNRVHPHIGLWFTEDAEKIKNKYGAKIEYMNHRQLNAGGTDPWCDVSLATHYVAVIHS